MAKKTNAEILAALATAADDAAKNAILDEAFGAAIGEVYSRVDSILSESGYQKPAGEKTLDSVTNYAKSASESVKAVAKAQKEAEKIKGEYDALLAKTPDLETVKNEHAKTLAAREAEYNEKLKASEFKILSKSVLAKANTIPIAETFKGVASGVLKMHTNELLNDYAIVEDGEVLSVRYKDNTAMSLRDAKGNPYTVDSYLAEKMAAFAPTDKPDGAPPANGANGNQKPSGTVTTKDKMEYAQKHGIDLSTEEGLNKISEVFPSPAK